MPCCDVINRGAALYGNLVIFGTLDAQLIALDKDTGKVVWKEKLGDYAAGYSYTAAPIIVKGKVITGVSGGEFGVIGRMDARDAMTGKLVWTRPTVEGHMGYKHSTRMVTRPKTASPARSTPPGPATSGKPAALPPGTAPPTMQKPT
jgi:alcohol dehydrogenase (cytochrome c)